MSTGSFVAAWLAVPVSPTPPAAVGTVSLTWSLFALSAAFRRRRGCVRHALAGGLRRTRRRDGWLADRRGDPLLRRGDFKPERARQFGPVGRRGSGLGLRGVGRSRRRSRRNSRRRGWRRRFRCWLRSDLRRQEVPMVGSGRFAGRWRICHFNELTDLMAIGEIYDSL